MSIQHRTMVQAVLDRSRALRIDIPLKVVRYGGYTKVTFHPSGLEAYYVADRGRFSHLVRSGRLPPSRTFPASFDRDGVSDWPDSELQEWLGRHAHWLQDGG